MFLVAATKRRNTTLGMCRSTIHIDSSQAYHAVTHHVQNHELTLFLRKSISPIFLGSLASILSLSLSRTSTSRIGQVDVDPPRS